MGLVKFRKKVGYSRTRSGRTVFKSYLWYYDDTQGGWEQLRGRNIDWYVSSTKRYGEGEFEVEEGTIIKEYIKEGMGADPEINYYIATSSGLKKVEPEERYILLDRMGPVELYRLHLVFRVDGEERVVPEDKYKLVYNGREQVFFDRKEAEEEMKTVAELLEKNRYYKTRNLEYILHNIVHDLKRMRKAGKEPRQAIGVLLGDLSRRIQLDVLLYPSDWDEVKKALYSAGGSYNWSSKVIEVPLLALADNNVVEKILKKSIDYEKYRDVIELLAGVAREVHRELMGYIAREMGLGPDKIRSISYEGESIWRGGSSPVIKVKTEYLGRDKFKEIVKKHRYANGWFYVELDKETSSRIAEIVDRHLGPLADAEIVAE